MESTQQSEEFNKLFTSWLEISKSFWPMDSGQQDHTEKTAADVESPRQEDKDEGSSNFRTWETTIENYNSFLRILSDPENQQELGNSFLTFSEMMAQSTVDTMEDFAAFQGQVINSLAKANEHTKTYSPGGITHGSFESFRDLYRTEFQKYLKMPKIGLPREFHERLSNLADSSTLFYSYLAELLYLFSQPFEKTNGVIQEKIHQMLENGEEELFKDPKKAYGEWIRILENHFMELFNSKEYTEVLNKTITSLAVFKNVRKEVMEVILKDLQIPTNKEMDEVYKDMYLMKKKVKQLSREVEALQSELKTYRN